MTVLEDTLWMPPAPKKYPWKVRPKEHAPVVDSGPHQWLNDLPFHEYKVNGVLTKFYAIGAIAKALGKSTVTIRSWEAKGWLPAPSFRSPSPKGEQLPGRPSVGLRLYTRDQLLFLVEAYERYISRSEKPDWDAFRNAIEHQYPR